MKRYRICLPVMAALLAVVSCTRTPETSGESFVGQPVCFQAEASVPETRTAYSGEVADGKERVQWLAGDRVSIYCPEAEDAKSVAYTIAGEAHESGSPYSYSTSLSAVSAALKWSGDNAHHFYGRYPDPSWSGAPAVSAFTGQSAASADFTCVIPASQAVTRVGSTYTYAPDMAYCYMTGYAQASAGNVVGIHFTPVVNTFEISIPSGFASGDIGIAQVKLVSSAHRLSGTYTVGIGSTPTYTISETGLSETDKSASAVISSPVALPSGSSAVVTIFTCPVTVAGTEADHLSLEVTLSNGDARTLPLKEGSAWLSYAPGGKYNITCGAVTSLPENAVTINSQGKRVILARGNLMARIGSYTSPIATASEWKFGDPMEYIGAGTSDGNYLFYAGNASCVGKWVDLFTFQGASCTNDASHRAHGLVNDNSDNKAYHGNGTGESTYDGCWNGLPIGNGGGYNWYPLSKNEWAYLLNSRTVSNTLSAGARYTLATVGSTRGMIIFPDNYVHPSGTGFTAGTFNSYSNYTATVSMAGWDLMEAAGCVFLPPAGWRTENAGFGYMGERGLYWTNTNVDYSGGYDLYFHPTNVTPADASHLYRGFAVRLARDAK